MARPSKDSATLHIVKKVFDGVLKYCPRLMKSQKIPEIPYVNHEAKREEIRARRSLKLGILRGREYLAMWWKPRDLPLSNDPSNDPHGEGDDGPATYSEKGTLAHVFGAAEDADIDVLGCDMTIDYASNYNLGSSQ